MGFNKQIIFCLLDKCFYLNNKYFKNTEVEISACEECLHLNTIQGANHIDSENVLFGWINLNCPVEGLVIKSVIKKKEGKIPMVLPYYPITGAKLALDYTHHLWVLLKNGTLPIQPYSSYCFYDSNYSFHRTENWFRNN